MTRSGGGPIGWLRRIPPGDPLERKHAITLQVFALVFCLGLLALEAARLFRGAPPALIASATNFTNGALAMLAVWWIRRGHYRRASWTFVAGFTAALAIATALGGLEFARDALKGLPTVLALAALLLGRRALWAVLTAFVSAMAVAWARGAGFLGGTGPHFRVYSTSWLFWISAFTFVIFVIILDRFGLTIREAFAQARVREQRLEVATAELLAANRALEVEVRERQRVAEELRNSQELLRVAFEISPYAIVINRMPEAVLVAANRGFTALTGYSQQEAVGHETVDLQIWMDPAQRLALFEQVQRETEVRDYDARLRRKDGSEFLAKLSAHRFELAGKPHLLTVTRDVSAARALEVEREKLRAQLVEAQKMEAVGTLAGGIAHDFNNIISVVQSYALLAGNGLAAGSPVHRDLEPILEASRRAADLVRQLLAFSRRQVVRPRPVDLGVLVTNTRRLLERVLPSEIVLRTSVADRLPAVLIDLGQIEQVVMNLSVNARDAMPQGGTLEIAARVERGSVALSVADTGAGIPRELQEKIFEPFFTTKAPGKGSGLGLATCYGIVRQAGGHIEVRSEPGQGTTFTVLLPPLAAEAAPEAAPLAKLPAMPTGTESVLLAEDEPRLREAIARMLRSLGYSVQAAANAEAALLLARGSSQPVQLLVSDVMMPGMRGTELARILTQELPGLRTLLISGYAAPEVLEARPGTAAFLGKPFSIEDLALSVRKLLDRA